MRGRTITDLIDPKNPPKCLWCKEVIDVMAAQKNKEKLVIDWNGLFARGYYHLKCHEQKENMGM